jgi:tellurite methyltransferase
MTEPPMREDRIKWNRRYLEGPGPERPARIIERCHSIARRGKALDIASGNGRNALFLARHGFEVDAVDISEVALRRASHHPGVRAVCTDLESFEIPPLRYDLIINIRYLNRRLFPYIHEGLSPGGVLIFETYLEGAGGAGKPACRDYFLRENELLHAFLCLRIRCYREGKRREPGRFDRTASLVALKPQLP